MTFQDRLKALKTKPVTVYVVGGAEYSGTMTDAGDDWIELDPGLPAAPPPPAPPLLMIPSFSIVCVVHR
jgi:hypothetical protein